MSKKMVVWTIVFAFLSMGLAPLSYAQTSVAGPTGGSSVEVPSYLEFSYAKVVRMDADANETDPFNEGTDISAAPDFDFGMLREVLDTDNVFQYMRGQYYYYVLFIATTSGRPYRITETGTQLSGAGTTIARESVLLNPLYMWADALTQDSYGNWIAQGAPPSGATVGPITTACSSTPSTVYEDTNLGAARLVRAAIAIAGPAAGQTAPTNYSRGYDGSGNGQGSTQTYTAWKPVTKDQTTGTYNGQITFTLTLI
jgi:hypothetical protein